MAKNKTSIDAFAKPAQKYVGKIEILGGVIPIVQQHRPYVKKEHDRPLGAEGKDLHPERPEIQKSPPKSIARGPRYQGKGGD